MTRNFKEEYKKQYRNAVVAIKEHGTHENIMLNFSLTKHGKQVFKKMNEQILSDAELDYKLGVLNEEEYKIEIGAYQIIERSLEIAEVY